MLPLSDFLVNLLAVRRNATASRSEFVFPGNGVTGHMVEPKKMLARVRALSGVEFTLHDLRRTFITVAESLDISAYALKRLLNHKDRHDVTAGYIVLSVERLRRPMQMIADQLTVLMTQDGDRMKADAKLSPLLHTG
jgi:integrase